MTRKLLLIYLFISFSISVLYTQEDSSQKGIYANIGLGFNYGALDYKTYLTQELGLSIFLTESILTKVGFGFESHSANFSGIQKDVTEYFSINVLGKYFFGSDIGLGAGFEYSIFQNTQSVNAAPTTAGAIYPDRLKFMVSIDYFREIMRGIRINPSLVARVILPSETTSDVDIDLGLFFSTAFNLKLD